MLQGVIIGATGTAVGAVLGLALCWVLDTYRLIQIPMDVYNVSYIPFVVEPLSFAVVIVSALLISTMRIRGSTSAERLWSRPNSRSQASWQIVITVTSQPWAYSWLAVSRIR